MNEDKAEAAGGYRRRRFGALSSSTNPEQLSATVTGAIVALSSVIILVGGLLGVPLTDSQVMQSASQIGAAVGGIWFVFGLVRKGLVLLQSRLSR